ncbi:FHA domain-containing protein [Aromatoleum toluclasticum]|uniref:FHA domain-containing protein n=1 Tax=Aromatoleum toluclasticum TaxID=92003 RepID=UPI001D17FC21|nr:FHA domain-containing protein [Aromatoleum toluclasticum]MCC4117870.1 FHA domain-containing protein [Aromatoleum toluclasticum]
MPKLILSMDGLVLKEIALDKEKISIGRKPNNDIQIDNLAISGQHALITTILDDSFLEDQNSTNGSYVNGQPVKKCVLRNNDVIELGKYRLKFIADVQRRSRGDRVEPSASLRSSAVAAGADQRADATQMLPPEVLAGLTADADEENSRLGIVKVLTGPTAGRELRLAKAMTTLGKPGVQVAVITRRAQGYFIAPAEGESFPQVNNRPIEAGAHPLNDGDILEIASVRMAFSLAD